MNFDKQLDVFSRNLSEIRRNGRYSYQSFSEKLRVGKSTVQAIESGDYNITLSTLITIANSLEIHPALLLLCKQAAKNFHTICKKETALKRVLSNLLSAVSLLRFKAVFSCGFRVPPGSGLYQSCAAGSVCIPAGQKYCSPRPRKSCPADRKTPGLPSRCIGHRW